MKKFLVLTLTAIVLCISMLAMSSCSFIKKDKGNDDSNDDQSNNQNNNNDNQDNEDDGTEDVHTHTMSDWSVEVSVTCTTDGKETRKCTSADCNHTESRTVTALGHDLQQINAQEPSCVEPGCEAYSVCKRCDYNTYKEIDPIGHDYTVDAELNPNGDKCVACGQSHVHTSYSEWTIVEGHEPDCTETGLQERKCDGCNLVETKEASKLAHDYNDDGKCNGCGDEKTDAPSLPDAPFVK